MSEPNSSSSEFLNAETVPETLTEVDFEQFRFDDEDDFRHHPVPNKSPAVQEQVETHQEEEDHHIEGVEFLDNFTKQDSSEELASNQADDRSSVSSSTTGQNSPTKSTKESTDEAASSPSVLPIQPRSAIPPVLDIIATPVGSPSKQPITTKFSQQDNDILTLTPINVIKSTPLSSSPVMIGNAFTQHMSDSPTLSTSPKPIQTTAVKKDVSPTNSAISATPGSPGGSRKSSNGSTTSSNTSTPLFVPVKTFQQQQPTSSGLANSIGSAINSIVSMTSTLSASLSNTPNSSSNLSTPTNTPSSASSSPNLGLDSFCDVHKDQHLNTWCHTCGDELICALCAISKHKGHDCDLVEEVFTKEKQAMKNQIVQMQQNISEKMEKLARDKNLMSEKYEEGLKEINESFDKLEKKIELKRKELLEQWKTCCEDEICEKILTSGLQQLSQIKFLTDGFLENLGKMELQEFFHSKTKKSLLIQVVIQQFQENLRKIDKSYLSDTLNVCVNFDNLKDTIEMIDRLGKIGNKNATPPVVATTNITHSSPSTPQVVTPQDVPKCRIEGKYLLKFGGNGSEDGQFSSPTDIAIDPNDNIIICDNGNNRVQIFDKNGRFLKKFPVPKPYGVTYDAKEGSILVTSDDHCVYAFDKSGNETGKFGSKGSDFGHFSYPTGIIVSEPKGNQHGSGKIIVCDHQNHRVQIFDKFGSFIKSFGTNGTNPEMEGGYFYGPNSIDIDIDGNLVITDRYNSRVQIFTLDGVFVRKFSAKDPSETTTICDPTGVCCLKKNIGQNYAAICDYNNNRIQIWNLKDGTLIKQFGAYGTADGQFDGPNGVSLTSEGHLVVVDYHNHRVQIFK